MPSPAELSRLPRLGTAQDTVAVLFRVHTVPAAGLRTLSRGAAGAEAMVKLPEAGPLLVFVGSTVLVAVTKKLVPQGSPAAGDTSPTAGARERSAGRGMERVATMPGAGAAMLPRAITGEVTIPLLMCL